MASKKFTNVYIKDNFAIVGPLERDGLLKNYDFSMDDYYYGERTFEQAVVMDNLLLHNKLTDSKIDLLVGGDLLNQICISNYNAAKYRIPYLGVYSACASFIEGLIVSSTFIESKQAKTIVNITSSHNLNAERQFRYPVEYGAIKKHTTTFTTTGACATLLTNEVTNIKIECATIGKALDMGLNDANNMGAIMAPAAAETLATHLNEMKRNASYYDLILTGDLGKVGKELFDKILGCKKYKKILVIATGSLQSVQLANQKLGIPGIAHAISLEVS